MTKSFAAAPLILPSNRPPTEACAPRADFTLLSHTLDNAPLLYPPRTRSRAASDLRQALSAAGRHRSVSVYVSLSEKIGLPLALLLRVRRIKTPHVLVAHHLTSPKKRALQERMGWLNDFTRVVVLAEPQADYLREEAGCPESRIVLLPDAVDTQFWQPQAESESEPFVLSVGQERRDYPALFAAARTCPEIPFVIVAGSAWAEPHTVGKKPPLNVTVHRELSYSDLRCLYARSALVVVPLEAGTRYAAGANGLLEAMAMGKPVILTETVGLKGFFRDTEAVQRLPAAGPAALGHAIRYLWNTPLKAATFSIDARRAVEARHSLETYVAALARTAREAEREP